MSASEPLDQQGINERFNLRLLGSPGVLQPDGSAVRGLGPGKPLAILAYLAVRREARRDELIELLWGDVPEAKARNAFSQALHRLRTALGERLIPQEPDTVRLGDVDLITIDRDLFLRHCDHGHADEASALYRGDFLEGLEVGETSFDRWADGERTRLRTRFEQVLRHAAQTALDAGKAADALRHVERLTAIAPFDGDAAQVEATILVAAGRTSDALSTLRRYSARIKEDLDITPPQGVRDLTARLERTLARQPAGGAPARGATAQAARNPFVGREQELARLASVVRDLGSERGATVLLDGEAGIGKTRLIDELLERVQPLGKMLVLRGRERIGGAAVPYAGIAEALRPAVKAPGVAGTSRHLLTEASRILPELRDAFGLDAPAPIDDDGGRLRFFEGVAALIDSAAYEQPVCFIVDDLHHASPSTLDLLTYLTSRLESSAVLFILSHRSEATSEQLKERLAALGHGRLTAALEDGQHGRLTLRPLSPSETDALVRRYLETKGEDGQVDVARVVQLANGHPMRALDLARRAARGALGSDLPVLPRDILWARLQAAPASQRRVFFAAALLERSASLRLLAAAAHLPEGATLDAAAELEQVGLLAQIGTGYTLAHDTTAAFVVEVSGVAGRALLAGWAAEALSHEDDATDAELANLYALAGRSSLAFTHARIAAYAAAAVGATAEVMRLLGGALTFAPDAAARAEIEEMLRAFGAGEQLLLMPQRDANTASSETPASASSATVIPLDEAPQAEAAPVPHDPPYDPPYVVETAEFETIADAPDAPEPLVVSKPARRVPALRPGFWVALLVATVVASIGIRRWVQHLQLERPARVLADSLVVAERSRQHDSIAGVVTGPLFSSTREAPTLGVVHRLRGPAWADSTTLPWIGPMPSPDGTLVAEERISAHGSDVYIIGPRRQDTVAVTVGGNQNVALAWSPDSRSLLVSRARTLANGGYDADLFRYTLGYTLGTSPRLVPIDTVPGRAVTEAAWSPDGLRIAWVAQIGPNARKIFVGRPDGSDVREVVDSMPESYDIAWSPDASLLGFTGRRFGRQHLYAYDFTQRRLWPLTSGPADDDHVAFSLDGRSAAYESTRDGDAGVYVMAALGGVPIRVTPAGRQYVLVGWRGRATPYVDRVRIIGPATLAPGDTGTFDLLGVDRAGVSMALPPAAWSLLDSGVLVRVPVRDAAGRVDSASSRYRVVATKAGTARLIASFPGWRADTVTIASGQGRTVLADDDFSHGIAEARWVALGEPLPRAGPAPEGSGVRVLFPNAAAGFGSGVLSRGTIELRQGLMVEARIYAPFNETTLMAGSIELALVSADGMPARGGRPPQLSRALVVSWSGQSDQMQFGVGTLTYTEPASALGPGASHVVRIAVGSGDSVTFQVDGRTRWRSTLQPLGEEGARVPLRLWIGGVSTSAWNGAVGRVSAIVVNGRQ